MPTSTFFNLPEEKKERIIEAAVAEFAQYSYYQSSINRIVDKADIAKGSFYQYFEGKEDLFEYIVRKIINKEFEYSKLIISNLEDEGFFQTLKILFDKLEEYYKERPDWLIVGIKFMKMDDSRLKEELLQDIIIKSNKFFKELLLKGIEDGEVDPEINVELTTVMITDLIIAVLEYSTDNDGCGNDMKRISNLFKEVLKIVRNGIKK